MGFFIPNVIIILCIAFIVYIISVKFFSEKYCRFISILYLFGTGIAIFIMFISIRFSAAQPLSDALMYTPLLVVVVFPYTMLPILFSHIALKIKYRGCEKPKMKLLEKLWWVSFMIFFVFSLLGLSVILIPIMYNLGLGLLILFSLFRTVYFVIGDKKT